MKIYEVTHYYATENIEISDTETSELDYALRIARESAPVMRNAETRVWEKDGVGRNFKRNILIAKM